MAGVMTDERKDTSSDMRAQKRKAKSEDALHLVITDTIKLWRRAHLTYDQTRYVAKAARQALTLTAPAMRARVVARLSREAESTATMIKASYQQALSR